MNRPADRNGSDSPGERTRREILERLASRVHTASTRMLRGILPNYSEALQFARRAFLLPGVEGPAAEEELGRLHAREQGRLLHEAAEIALAQSLEGRLLTAPLELLPRLDEWNARCAAEIDRAVSDRVSVDGALLACGLSDPPGWPTPEELIHGACRLSPSRVGLLALARALFAAGRRDEARARYVALTAGTLPARRRAQLHEASGIACEAALDLPRALEHYERAGILGGGARASLAAGITALELGVPSHVARAVERLEEQRLDPARLQRLSREAAERRALLGRPWTRRLEVGVREILTACAARPSGGRFA